MGLLSRNLATPVAGMWPAFSDFPVCNNPAYDFTKQYALGRVLLDSLAHYLSQQAQLEVVGKLAHGNQCIGVCQRTVRW
jgi:hypothetical protein